MRFAIPMANGKLTAHFGHCKEFALIDVEENEIKNKKMLSHRRMNPVCCPGGSTNWALTL